MANVGIVAIILLTSLMLGGCDNEPGAIEESFAFDELPLADFNYKFQGDCNTPVVEVLFENGSKNADEYLWEFGNDFTNS